MEESPPVSKHETGSYEMLPENKTKTECKKKIDHDEKSDSDHPSIGVIYTNKMGGGLSLSGKMKVVSFVS
jgi:hypothetical protein